MRIGHDGRPFYLIYLRTSSRSSLVWYSMGPSKGAAYSRNAEVTSVPPGAIHSIGNFRSAPRRFRERHESDGHPIFGAGQTLERHHPVARALESRADRSLTAQIGLAAVHLGNERHAGASEQSWFFAARIQVQLVDQEPRQRVGQ